MRTFLDWLIVVVAAGVAAYVLILQADPIAGYLVQIFVRK